MHGEPTLPEAVSAKLRPVRPAPAVEYTQLRADVAARLGRVCGDMPPEAFEALVDDIWAMKVRWARTATAGRGD